MRKILTIEKLPYFLTAILAIIVIQFNYIIDATLKIPIIEYSFGTDGENPNKIQVLLTNISSDKSISNFYLQMKFPNDSKATLESPDIDAIPPAARITVDPSYIGESMLNYRIKIIHPGQSYKLVYKTNSTNELPNFNFDSIKPMKLLEKSLFTLLIKNQLLINLLLMIFFIIFAIFYFINLPSIKKL